MFDPLAIFYALAGGLGLPEWAYAAMTGDQRFREQRLYGRDTEWLLGFRNDPILLARVGEEMRSSPTFCVGTL